MMGQLAGHLGDLQVSGSKQAQPTSYPEKTMKLKPEVSKEAGAYNDYTPPVPLVRETGCRDREKNNQPVKKGEGRNFSQTFPARLRLDLRPPLQYPHRPVR